MQTADTTAINRFVTDIVNSMNDAYTNVRQAIANSAGGGGRGGERRSDRAGYPVTGPTEVDQQSLALRYRICYNQRHVFDQLHVSNPAAG